MTRRLKGPANAERNGGHGRPIGGAFNPKPFRDRALNPHDFACPSCQVAPGVKCVSLGIRGTPAGQMLAGGRYHPSRRQAACRADNAARAMKAAEPDPSAECPSCGHQVGTQAKGSRLVLVIHSKYGPRDKSKGARCIGSGEQAQP